jgi:RNA polymerase sigma factor (TIGR02999 family)
MDGENQTPVTKLLNALAGGDRSAQDELFNVIYSELHKIARSQVGGIAAERTLQPTALVHEAYVKLFRQTSDGFDSRKHFFATAAQAMRQLCVDDVRWRKRKKRGGDAPRESLECDAIFIEQDLETTLAVHEALNELATHDPDKAELVTMRFFAGLTVDQCANVLNISPRTAATQWRFAKAWLHRQLDGETPRRESDTKP